MDDDEFFEEGASDNDDGVSPKEVSPSYGCKIPMQCFTVEINLKPCGQTCIVYHFNMQ